jgi:hypothetical protein
MADMISNFEMKIRYLKAGKAPHSCGPAPRRRFNHEHNQLDKRPRRRLVDRNELGRWVGSRIDRRCRYHLPRRLYCHRRQSRFRRQPHDHATGATFDESSAGSLTLSGGLSLYNGVAFLNGANSIGSSVEVVGGLLAVGNGGALGNGAVLLYGGELLATTTETINASMAFNGTTTIAAATGRILTLEGGAQPGESHLEFRRHIGRVLRFE